MEEHRYELRVINDTEYNSYSDISDWYFSNGYRSSTCPAGHSDKRRFPPGTVVLCLFIKGKNDKGKDGYFMAGFAKVTKFSEGGCPVEFGESLSNTRIGRWEPPGPEEVIYDGRVQGEAKEIKIGIDNIREEESSRAKFLREGIIEQLEEHALDTLDNLEATLKRGLEDVTAERVKLAILTRPLP